MFCWQAVVPEVTIAKSGRASPHSLYSVLSPVAISEPPRPTKRRIAAHISAGVDTARFHGGVSGKSVREEFGLADVPVVGLVANVRGSKGHAVFLEATREMLARRPHARFLIVGDGVGFDDVRRRVREMGLEARVIMTGFRRDIPEVMAALDVLVLPSIRSEATSQVVPQALAVGTPVVGGVGWGVV